MRNLHDSRTGDSGNLDRTGNIGSMADGQGSTDDVSFVKQFVDVTRRKLRPNVVKCNVR